MTRSGEVLFEPLMCISSRYSAYCLSWQCPICLLTLTRPSLEYKAQTRHLAYRYGTCRIMHVEFDYQGCPGSVSLSVSSAQGHQGPPSSACKTRIHTYPYPRLGSRPRIMPNVPKSDVMRILCAVPHSFVAIHTVVLDHLLVDVFPVLAYGSNLEHLTRT